MSALPPLPAPLLKALNDKGFESLTEVQEAVLDPALEGADLLVSAQTGSGKTLAFGLALAKQLLGDDDRLPPPEAPLALIIAPTRELALQVGRELEWLYAPAGAVIAHCVGGMDARAERRALERGAHIVVGTPGRLRDHLERNALNPEALSTVVLDEADEMLDLGFREDLEFMLAQLPTPRRTLMFSATLSPEITRLAHTYMDNPERLAMGPRKSQHSDIAYQALVVEAADHEMAIVNVLRYHEARNAIVFCKTRAAVNHLTARFHNRGFAVVPLSGELAQEERSRALQALRDGRARVCVATDVAARGIDLPGLDLVIHADLPGSPETLLHRSGRTGRAGRKGVSVLIVPLAARKKVQRLLGSANLTAEWASAPSAADVAARDTERLLTDATLTAPETPEEGTIITTLAERFTARELAAAVARQYFAARSAPEDVAQVDPGAQPAARGERGEREGYVKRDRNAFAPGPWFRLSVGAEDGAEPRWILPLVCRAGDITREDIGAIRVQEDHTLVQISQEAGSKFLGAISDTMMLDDKVSIEETDEPDLSKLKFVKMGGPRGRNDRDGDRGGFRGRRDEGGFGDRPQRGPRKFDRDDERGERPARAPRRFEDERPARPAFKRRDDEGFAPRGDREDRKPYAPREERKSFGDREERKPYGERPARRFDDERPARPAFKRRDDEGFAPRGDREDRKPYAPREERKSFGDRDDRKPYGERPARKEGFGGKPAGKFGGKKFESNDDRPARPRFDSDALRDPSARLGGKPVRAGAGKPAGKFGAKPAGKPFKGKPSGGDAPRRGPSAGGSGAPRRPRG